MLNAPPRPVTTLVNAMSIDVEDYFQAQSLEGSYPRPGWDALEARVARNTDEILELLADNGVAATFFTLGWIAERNAPLIRRIVDNGHELASHGYEHIRADAQDRNGFRSDVRRTKNILEDLSGAPVRGYRAATFSIGRNNLWAFDVLAEEGYSYSSSVYPIRHDNYGMAEAPRAPFHPLADAPLLEVPISTVRVAGRTLPCGGGGFFRLLPYAYSRWAVRRINAEERRPAVFYFHPWEIDAGQPRPAGVGFKSRVRHYTNLARMKSRLARIIADFRWDRMDRVFLPTAG